MAVRSARRRGVPLTPDMDNRNPYRGLPHDYPSTHSRFPIVPHSQIGDLSFVPPVSENGSTEGIGREVTPEARAAWRDVIDHALGDVAPDDSGESKPTEPFRR